MTGFVSAAVAISAAVVAGSTIYSANKQARAQRQAAEEQKRIQQEQLRQREIDFKRANQNDVDTSAIAAKAQGGDLASTMLTGAGGVDPNKLKLGGNSLLGG